MLHEDIKYLKADMDVLKNKVKALAGIKQERKMLKKSVESLKKDIKLSNLKIKTL